MVYVICLKQSGNRGFQKASGEPIRHKDQTLKLITAMMTPKQLVIIKCEAH